MSMPPDSPERSGRPDAGPLPRPRLGLSGKLLILTTIFVMVAEVLIYVPSIANFRRNWLNDRIAAAQIAALVLAAARAGAAPANTSAAHAPANMAPDNLPII